MKTCPCGRTVATNARACPYCGKRFHTFLAKLFFWGFVAPVAASLLWVAFTR